MKKLKSQLEKIYNQYSNLENTSDPLHLIHQLKDKKDIEVFAFLASLFAYGSVKQINNTLSEILNLSEGKPFKFIKTVSNGSKLKIKHRFYSESDVTNLIILLRKILYDYNSLKDLFAIHYSEKHQNVKYSISGFSNHFLSEYQKIFGKPTIGIKFMFPLPEKGSACKRMNLFLRWMVRYDNLDFGLWNFIPTSKLVIPVDIHIAKISKQLGLTKRKVIGWKMAEEITENLKCFDKDDPVRFDYALCHFDMINKNFSSNSRS